MNLSIYLSAAAGGVPILFLVFGAVQLMKKLTKPDGTPALTGNALLLAALAWGLALGLGFWAWQTRPPASPDPYEHYVYWFAGAAYGLGLGFLASLFWDALRAIAEKAVAATMGGTALNRIDKTVMPRDEIAPEKQ